MVDGWGQVRPEQFALVTNHGAVLFYVAAHPDARIQEIADETGITQRRVAEIIRQLHGARFLEREKVGRRNRYLVRGETNLRHRVFADVPVHVLLEAIERYRRGAATAGITVA
jgi:DNA-binding MarR family transcriptional regulator